MFFYNFFFKERTKNAQFIIISLRNNMFELADRLFGIYKVNNCTSATYICPELCEIEDKLKKQQNPAVDNENKENREAEENINLLSSPKEKSFTN
jgi:hypothetical protein